MLRRVPCPLTIRMFGVEYILILMFGLEVGRPEQPETPMIAFALNGFTPSIGVLTPGTFSRMYGLLNSKRPLRSL